SRLCRPPWRFWANPLKNRLKQDDVISSSSSESGRGCGDQRGPSGEAIPTERPHLAGAGWMELPGHWRARHYPAHHSRNSFSGGRAGRSLDRISMGALAACVDEAEAGPLLAATDQNSAGAAESFAPQRPSALKIPLKASAGRLHWN